jgi:hypothetical protein
LRILWFHLFAVIEWLALFSLIFAMFRFKLRDHVSFIIITALFISMFSYLIRDVLDLVLIAPFIQLIFLIFAFKFVLRIPMVYAGIIVSFGYITFASLQILMLLIFERLSLLKIDSTFLKNFNMVYLITLISSLITFFIISFLVRHRIGFTFIPKQKGLRTNLPFVVLILLSVASLGLVLLFMNTLYLQTLFVGMNIILLFMLHFFLKREKEDLNI